MKNQIDYFSVKSVISGKIRLLENNPSRTREFRVPSEVIINYSGFEIEKLSQQGINKNIRDRFEDCYL